MLIALAATAAGCANESDTDTAGADAGSLDGRTFVSRSITDGGRPRPLVPGTEIRLTFPDDGRIVATAGCNTMSGAVTVESQRLTIGDLAVTEMGCDSARHEQDKWVAEMLTADPEHRLDGRQLTLIESGTTLVLEG